MSIQLYPPYNQLTSLTNKNYDTAIEYYKQKENAFRYAMGVAHTNFLQDFANDMTKRAQQYHNYVRQAALSVISKKGKGIRAARQQAKSIDNQFDIDLDSLYQKARAGGFKGLDFSALGEKFEAYMANYCLSDRQVESIQDFPDLATNNLLSQLFGKITNVGATVKGSTQTRTDVLISEPGKVLKETQVELKTLLDLEGLADLSSIDLSHNFYQALCDSGVDQTVFGFQVKGYETYENKKWTQSSVLAGELQDILTNWKMTSATWSSNYAINYPFYYLSKYIINIVNPVNIAVVNFQSFEFMSEFLSHIRFYMEIRWAKTPKEKSVASTEDRGGGFEIYPELATDQILMKNIRGAFNGVKTTRREIRSKSQGDKYKNLKVAQIINNK